MTVDSNGYTQVTSSCILYIETEEAIKWYINQILSISPNLNQNLNAIFTDKDHKIKKCLKQIFPNSHLFICKFHVMQIFQHEVTTNKYNINSETR